MLTRALYRLIHLAVRRPLLVLALAGSLSGVAILQLGSLRIDTDFANLLPERYPSVKALKWLQEEVGAESTVDIALQSDDLQASMDFAEALIPRALALEWSATGERYFKGVDYRNDLRYLQRYALYFAAPNELDTLEAFLRAQAARARRLADTLGSSSPPSTTRVPDESALRRSLASVGLREYYVSEDSTILGLRFYPAGAQTDIGFIDALYRDLDSLIAAVGPSSYAPDLEVTTAGRLLRQSVEIHAITDDVQRSFGAGVAMVLLVVMLFFFYKTVQARTTGRIAWQTVIAAAARAPVTAVVLGVPLLMALSWAGGVAALAFGTLNLMTATLGLVLFGLGIDYGIHFFARYAEERGKGETIERAAEVSFTSTGQAIAISAITTAGSLYVLTIADFRGFSEFGWIGGSGILFAMVSMLIVLPALISLSERLRLLNFDGGSGGEDRLHGGAFPLSRLLVGVSVAVSAYALWALPDTRFEYDFGALNPVFPEYEARAARVQPVFDTEGRLRNPAYLLLTRAEDVPEAVEALRERAAQDTLVYAVLSLQERFPTDTASIRDKLGRLRALRELLDDPFLQLDTTGAVDRLREALSIVEPVPLDSVPDFLRRPFTTRTGEVGNFVLVYASESLSDGRVSIRFADLVGQVRLADGQTVQAASTSIVAADMLRLMLGEAPLMVLITALLVMTLVALTFRSVRWTLLALTPLVVGLLWMLAVMEVVGIPFTFYNLVVLPAILGIGNDAGVHLIHRYREEGAGSILFVIRSTGEHVAMGALTTLIGFGGQLLSFHPGLRSIGLLAVIGNTTILAAALIFLPALIQVSEDYGWLPSTRGTGQDHKDHEAQHNRSAERMTESPTPR